MILIYRPGEPLATAWLAPSALIALLLFVVVTLVALGLPPQVAVAITAAAALWASQLAAVRCRS